MNKEIESKWYIDTEDYMNFRYYLDDDGLWFNYKDMYDRLDVSGRKADGFYKDLYEGNKRIYKDLNESVDKSDNIKFINLAGLQQIEQKVIERFGLLYKHINLLGRQLNLENNNIVDIISFKNKVDMILTEVYSEENDYDKLANYAKALCESKEVQKMKNRKYDADKEELIDMIIEDIYAYDDYIDEVEITLITRKEDMNDTFKQCDYCRESTCPSWLRNCVK